MALVDDIFATALSYTDADAKQQRALRQFCAAEEKRLKDQLSEGVTVADCYETFVCAAGLLAAADFSAAYADTGIRSFSAGPISITREDTERAARLRQQAAQLMLPWCRSTFRFMGVRG